MTAWTTKLPTSNAVAAARALHDALAELNHWRTDHGTRFAILEQLRPFVLGACAAVARHRSATPLLLDDRARSVAALAQRTQHQLATGYRIVVVTALRAGIPLEPATPDDSPTRTVVIAIHRAMTELLHTLLRSLQFHTPPPAALWAQLHTLYALAELRRVQDEPVRDALQALLWQTVPADVYKRAVLLATAQPNKLRSSELGELFKALESWTGQVAVVPFDALEQPVMVVDLESDRPPRATQLSAVARGNDLRTLDTRRLVRKFEEYLAAAPGKGPSELGGVDRERRELIRHCAHVWGARTDRAYERTPASGSVEVCTTLEHVHFHAGGGRSLLRQLQSQRLGAQDPAEAEILDPFAGAADLGGVRTADSAPVPRRHLSSEVESQADHPLASLELTDRSPLGFGLICAGEAPGDVQAGQLLALREADDPDWRITVVRWVANGRDRSRLGVETLAQRALSGGARLISSRGRVLDFKPALLLPGVEALDQPPSLITAPGVFQTGQKLAFTQGGRERKLLVEERIVAS
ncbi:MAG: hypothetical protein V2J24_10685, partial [Pseudomonadales bacterium]|nr:hypothetical protein [Pseudomonadales bacterium]